MEPIYQSDTGGLARLVLKHARDAFLSDAALEDQWRNLNYQGRPNAARAIEEYDEFVELLRGPDVDLHFLPPKPGVGADSIYCRDAAVACDKGMILCNMGKAERRGEPALHGEAFLELGIPVHGSITGEGTVEGGDVVWIDPVTVAVGRGYRTNDEGIRQLHELLRDSIEELVVVPLPHHRGPDDVFHLMTILSPLDEDLALVYSPLMPVPFRDFLLRRGIRLVEVPEGEFDTMGSNVLAVAPRRSIMLAGNPETRRRLEAAGVEVAVFPGEEICHKGCGGPTCLVRPILRRLGGAEGGYSR